MILTENQKKKVEGLLESYDNNTLEATDAFKLLEKGEEFVSDSLMEKFVRIASLEDKLLKESVNTTGDLATYNKKLQPLLRRIMPALLAMDTCSVQPVEVPDTSLFMIKSRYGKAGTVEHGADARIVTFSLTGTAPSVGDTVTGATSGATGVVDYVEAGAVILHTVTGTFTVGENLQVSAVTFGTFDAIYSSELAFKKILKAYSGSYATTDAETRSANEIEVFTGKLAISTVERMLKTSFTQEMVQDMKALFGVNAEKEIMDFLAIEIMLELDREVIDTYKSIASLGGDLVVYEAGDEFQKSGKPIMLKVNQRINKSCNDLATRNRRGKGNIVIATSGVISALEDNGAFREHDYAKGIVVGQNASRVYVGTLKNGARVYQDWYATTEYFMTIYKGESAFDAGVVYSPYQPLWFANAMDASTLQPVIGAKMRYALTANTLLDDDAGYAEYVSVDFAGTVYA